MKKIALFGGTGGIGVKLAPYLKDKYNVLSLGSKDVDVTDYKRVCEIFEKNDIDIVINLSAKSYDTYVSKIGMDNYSKVIDMTNVNILGNINIVSACLPKMIQNKWGRIICISSVLSTMTIPKTALYSASKAYLDRFINVVNKENAKFGVTCNTIQLGYFGEGLCNVIPVEQQEVIKSKISLNRWGYISELHNAIECIIENEYICGTNLKIDGGL